MGFVDILHLLSCCISLHCHSFITAAIEYSNARQFEDLRKDGENRCLLFVSDQIVRNFNSMSGISPTNRYSCERLSPAPHLSPNADLISQLQIIKKERAMEHGTDSHEYMAYANAISALNSWPVSVHLREI